MYQKPFFITTPVWNNAFSFEKRENKKLYIPSLIKINSFDEIKLLPHPSPLLWKEREQKGKTKVTFEDFDFDWKLQSCTWLENFYEIPPINPPLTRETLNTPIYLFDNHNHAFYFWHLAKSKNIIQDDNLLIHIDEHADMREPENFLTKNQSLDLKKVFKYTNFELNVWNYIIPALKTWIIKEVLQIRSEENLDNFLKNTTILEKYKWKIILNLDLDFFETNLDYINYDLKKKVILYIAKKSSLITIATSPFFIDQNLALKVLHNLLLYEKKNKIDLFFL